MQHCQPCSGMILANDFRPGDLGDFPHVVPPRGNLRIDRTTHDGQILLGDLAAFELSSQSPGGFDPLGKHQHTGRTAVKAMRYSQVGCTVWRRSLEQVGTDSGLKAIELTRSLRRQSTWFVDHQNISVFE